MINISTSNCPLDYAMPEWRSGSPGRDATWHAEPYSAVELSRALSRWENEGGTISSYDTRPGDARGALG